MENTVEQMCRDLLTIAIEDELVKPIQNKYGGDPQCFTSGDLLRVADKLQVELRKVTRRSDELSKRRA